MPAVIPIGFQFAALATAGALELSAATTTLLMGGASLLGGFVAGEIFGSDGSAKNNDAESLRVNSSSLNKTIPIVYGKRLLGSNDVFVQLGTKGDGTSNKKKYIWVAHAICEGFIEGINQVEVDGVFRDEIYVNGELMWKYEDGLIKHWVMTGSNIQEVIDEIKEGTDGKFNDPMRNTAHIIFRFEHGKTFNGVPSREAVVKGRVCLDTRDGLQKWTQNPALILYDYLTNDLFGLGWSASKINVQSFNETATYCDEQGWEINYVVANQAKSQTIIETILGHFRGALYNYNRELYLKYLDTRIEVPSNIYDEHIARDSSGKAMVSVSQPSRFNIPVGATVNFTNERNNWTTDRIRIGETRGQLKTLDFPAFTKRDLAMEMGTYVLERERLNRSYTFVLRSDKVAFDINDLALVTSTELSITNQLVRIKSVVTDSSGLVSIVAVLDDDSLYDKTFDPDTSDVYEVDFADIAAPPPPLVISDISVVEDLYSFRGRTSIRLVVFFSPPEDYEWFSHVDVYIGLNDLETGNDPTEDQYYYRLSAPSSFQIDPVEEGRTYFIRLNAVSTYGVVQTNEEAVIIAHKVKGIADVTPTCPQYLDIAVNFNAIDIKSNVLPDPDILGYEIRSGSTWQSAIFVTFGGDPSVSFNGVKPGTHTFWLNTKHTNGVYCGNPLSKDIIIEEPPLGSRLFFEEVVNYGDGDSVNTTTIGSYPNQTLNCTHANGIHEGQYTSKVIDTGNLDGSLEDPPRSPKMVIYILFDYALTGGDNTWANLAPAGVNWLSFGYDTVKSRWKTWYELLGDFKRGEAARVQVSIEYSSSADGPWEPGTWIVNSVTRLELLSAIVTGRFVRIRYNIGDINDISFLTLSASTLKAAYLEDSLLIDI